MQNEVEEQKYAGTWASGTEEEATAFVRIATAITGTAYMVMWVSLVRLLHINRCIQLC